MSEAWPATGALAAELAFARELALRAGEIVLAWSQRKSLAVEDKDGQPVTQADRESNELIVGELSARFPADAILAEETPVTDGAWHRAERCWVVDPLDGTSDFVKGRVGFCVMIGLLVAGRPVLGAVVAPKAGRSFYGLTGRGAWEERDGVVRALHTSRRAQPEELRVIASIAHRDAHLEAALAALTPAETFALGSVGLKVGAIAADEADLYVATTSAISLWDTVAPHAILLGAGGDFVDLDGAALDYSGPGLRHARGLLATNGACREAVVARLAGKFPVLK